MRGRIAAVLVAAFLAFTSAFAADVTNPTTTGTTITPFTDASNALATDQFVQGRALLAQSFTPFAGITGGTYSFATLGTGAIFVVQASSGIITNVLSVATAGTNYAVGDVLTPMGGNTDAYLRVTGVSGTGVTTAQVIYGGTGYGTGGSVALTPAKTFPAAFSASGTLTSNVTVIIPNGTFLLGGQQRVVANNTTGAFSTSLCISNGADACTGTQLTVPQGTGNSAAMYWFTDGSTGVWLAATPAGIGAAATANNLSDLASASSARTNLGLGTAATQAYTTGSWTPAITFGGASTGITYSAQFGIFTQIGNQVCVEGTIQMTAVGSSTGTAVITGLPVTTRGGSNPDPVFSIVITNFSSTTINAYAFSASGSTTITLNTLAIGVQSVMTNANFTATSFLSLNGCYFQ